jgi:ABC-type sugar transport system permease subunit
MILVFLLIPIYISLMIIKTSYESNIQEELNRQIIENIKKGEEEFYQTFQMMISISNVFVLDRDLISILRDGDSSYWDRNKRFDEITNYKMGYGAAMSWILFILLFIVTLIQWKGQKKWVGY